MLRAACVLFGTAAFVSSVDLTHKAAADGALLHGRSAFYAVAVAVASAAWAAAILITRSPRIALGGGVVLGGAVANLASLAVWHGVPDPIIASAIAFNLADVFVVAGFVGVAAAVLTFARAHRERLGEPVRVRPGRS